MRPLRIFTPCFGPKHVSLLERALARSLMWPKNKAAIKDAKWSILAHFTEFKQIVEIAARVLPPEQLDIMEVDTPMHELIARRGVLMNRAFCQAIEKCLNENAQLLISTVDFIWADGSIENLKTLAQQKNTCIAIPHPRVLPSILDSITDTPQTSYDLVTLARQHPHRSWTTCEIGQSPSGTHIGGILWRKVAPGIVTLQHRLPSPYLCNVNSDDLAFFRLDTPQKVGAWGAIDHDWATELMQKDRWRTALSSDIAFMAEVTDHDQNVPPMSPTRPHDPDTYWHSDYNHVRNRQYVATFRGEP